jgi:hypothetical protein
VHSTSVALHSYLIQQVPVSDPSRGLNFEFEHQSVVALVALTIVVEQLLVHRLPINCDQTLHEMTSCSRSSCRQGDLLVCRLPINCDQALQQFYLRRKNAQTDSSWMCLTSDMYQIFSSTNRLIIFGFMIPFKTVLSSTRTTDLSICRDSFSKFGWLWRPYRRSPYRSMS